MVGWFICPKYFFLGLEQAQGFRIKAFRQSLPYDVKGRQKIVYVRWLWWREVLQWYRYSRSGHHDMDLSAGFWYHPNGQKCAHYDRFRLQTILIWWPFRKQTPEGPACVRHWNIKLDRTLNMWQSPKRSKRTHCQPHWKQSLSLWWLRWQRKVLQKDHPIKWFICAQHRDDEVESSFGIWKSSSGSIKTYSMCYWYKVAIYIWWFWWV